MGIIAKINQADLLEAIINRLILRIDQCNSENTYVDDDPTTFANEAPPEKYQVIVTALNGVKKDSGSVQLCEIEERSDIAVGVYWRSAADAVRIIHNKLIKEELSFFRYWKPAVLDAMMVDKQDSTVLWMPLTKEGHQMLTEPMQVVQMINPKRGDGWTIYMQIVFAMNFKWDLRGHQQNG